MAYTNRHIYIQFDGTMVNPNADREKDDSGKILPSEYDENGQLVPIFYPELGDDIWVNVRNPMLMPQSLLIPSREVPTDDKGNPLNVHDALAAGGEVIAGLIVDWCLYDPFAEDDVLLPKPSDVPREEWADLMRKVPQPVTDAISDLVKKARNPR